MAFGCASGALVFDIGLRPRKPVPESRRLRQRRLSGGRAGFPGAGRGDRRFQSDVVSLAQRSPAGWIGEVNEYFVRVTGRPVWPFVFFPEDAWLSQKMNAAEWVETFDEALSGGSTGLIAFPFARMPGTVGFEVFRERFGE